MNERAASTSNEPAALWRVGRGAAFFAGPLNRNAPHQHSVPVFLAGLYGRFRFRVGDAAWVVCRTAVVPAGVAYEFDMGGDPLAVFYLEPSVAGVDALVPLAADTHEIRGTLVGASGEVAPLRRLYEQRTSLEGIELALRDLAGFCRQQARRQMDPRIVKAVEQMQRSRGAVVPVSEIAASVGLSASRFQHVFTAHVGVPFRRYRAWHRLRAAIHEVVRGASYTEAAHAAGFADQSHFARDFRRTFGAPASRGLRPTS